jgi:hypothetical protein
MPCVRMTQVGAFGHSGMGFPGSVLFLADAARARVLSSAQAYTQAAKGLRVVRSFPQLSLARSTFCMAMHFALDQGALLPPFMPVWRNEDGVFGWLLGACAPSVLTAFLPLIVRHESPAPQRPSTTRIAWSQVGRSTCTDLSMAILREASPLAAPAGPRRLQDVGQELARVAALPPDAFMSLVAGHHTHFIDFQIGCLRRVAGMTTDGPRLWRRDHERYLTVLAARRIPRLDDLCIDIQVRREPLRRLQQTIGRFAALLKSWDDLVAASSMSTAAENKGVDWRLD